MNTILPFFKANKMKTLVVGIIAVTCMSFSAILFHPTPPEKCTGSPYDSGNNGDCTGCHTDAAINGGPGSCSITTNIPACGYIPGTTYTITVSANHQNALRFEFEFSPQDSVNGNAKGTLIPLSGTSLIPSFSNYICGANDVSDNMSWNFKWTAPSLGTGGFKFYAIVNASNADGAETGDTIYAKSIKVVECIATPPSASASGTNATCNLSCNGTATVTASNGTPPYTYAWGTSPIKTTSVVTGLCAGSYSVLVTDAAAGTATASVTITAPSAITTTVTSTAVSCFNGNDGTATASALGGTGTKTYSWNTSPTQNTVTATGLIAGNYTVTVTDANSCTKTASVSISQPTVITTSTTVTNVICNGGNNGSATASASGGTGTKSFSWNTSPVQNTATATGLIAGNYTVTVTDANSCTKTATVSITEPAVLAVTTSVTIVNCKGGNDGSATVSPSGGTSPYTYGWNSSPVQTTATATGLLAGNYTATVTDSKGCSTTATVSVTEPAAIVSASVSSSTNVLCNGNSTGDATASGSGGTGIIGFSWNTTPVQSTAIATGLAAGNYMVTATDVNGCTATATVLITEPTAVTSSVTATTPASCGNSDGSATVTASGGTGTLTYSWNTSPVQTTAIATGLAANNYTVTVTDANGCSVSSVATISNAGAPTVSVTPTDVTCNGGNNGNAVATVSGGVSPYTYAWCNTETTSAASNLSAGTCTLTVTDNVGCITIQSVTINEPTAITSTVSASDVTCNGANDGTIQVNAAGGTGGFSYLWNTTATTSSISNLSPASYSLTITDANSCSLVVIQAITEPTALTASVSASNVNCNGGSDGTATVTPAGGTSAYTYGWSTTPVQNTATATGLTAGDYTATVTDANGCFTTATITITEPLVLAATISATNVNCNGGADGTATVSPTGGTSAYTYVWSTTPVQNTATVTGLTAGDYTATVTDANGCATSETVTITEPAALTSTTSVTNINCNGGLDGTATVTPNGGASPYSYAWSTTPVQNTATATGLDEGGYTVTVTDANGCSTTTTVTITQPLSALTTTMDSTDQTVSTPPNGSATATPAGGTSPYTYLWNPSNQTSQTATGLSGGTYTVTITDNMGCTATGTVIVNNTVGVISASIQPEVKIYPNPNSGEFDITLNVAVNNDYTIELSNMFGQIIYKEALTNFIGNYNWKFDISEFGSGIYFMNIRSKENQLLSKIVVY